MKNTRAVTLIEVLLSMAVLALLVAVVAPGLLLSSEQSKRKVCASHLRRLGQAMAVYAQDGGVFPAIGPMHPQSRGRGFYPPDRVTLPTSTTGVPSVTVDLWTLVRLGMATPAQFICPSTTDQPDPALDPSAYYDFLTIDNLSYGYQFQHDGAPPSPGLIGTQTAPTFPIMADANPYITGQITRTPTADRRSAERGNSLNHTRRVGQNVLFQDGQVRFETSPDVGLAGWADGFTVRRSRGRDNCYSGHIQNGQVDAGLPNSPTWRTSFNTEDGVLVYLGGKSDACLIP